MLKAVIRFYWGMIWSSLLPAWLECKKPDPKHFHRRRFTPQYRSKQRIVLYLWGGAAALVIVIPFVPLVVFISMLTAFLSLAILDETA